MLNGRMARGTCLENSQTRAIAITQSVSVPSLTKIVPWFESRTQILHIFIASKCQNPALLSAPSLCAGTVSLVNHDTIGCSCRDESSAVGESSPSGVEVEGHVRQAIAKCAEEECEVTRTLVRTYPSSSTLTT